MNAVVLIAHAPLSSALRDAALHVLPDVAPHLLAVDVDAALELEQSVALACAALNACGPGQGILILTDVVGATPCNIAVRLLDPARMRLLAGANLPMVLRALTYSAEPLDVMAQRALAGGATGVLAVDAPRDDVRAKDCS